MNHLTADQIDALPVGSVIADREGDRITRLAAGWQYSKVVGLVPATQTHPRPGHWGPYTLVSTGDHR